MLSDGRTRGPNWFLKRIAHYETFAAVRERLFADRPLHSTRKLLCNLVANSFLGEAVNEGFLTGGPLSADGGTAPFRTLFGKGQ